MTTKELKGLSFAELEKLSFTDKFLNNELILDILLNELDIKHQKGWYYSSGDIMIVLINLTDKNKKVLSKIIKDFNAYNILVEKAYTNNYTEGVINAAYLIDYNKENFGETLLFDWDKGLFYYKGADE
jgi:hypothetical protein